MNASSVDIKQVLITELETSSFSLFPIFIGKEPDEPVNSITIFDTASFPTEITMGDSKYYDYASLQIRIRSYAF